MQKYKYFMDLVVKVLKVTISLLCLVLLSALLIQVINRYALSQSWPFLQLLIPFCIIWLTMLGSAVAFREKLHFEVDMFTHKIGRYGRLLHGLIITALSIAASSVMIYSGYAFFLLGSQKTDPATGYSLVFTYSSILIGSILIFLFLIEQGLDYITDYKKKGENCNG